MRTVRDPIEIAKRVARRFMRRDDYRDAYTHNLAIEAILWLYDVTGETKYLDYSRGILHRRAAARGRAFPASYLLYLRIKDDRYVESLVASARNSRRNVTRAHDGAAAYGVRPELARIFVDMLQGYASSMARAGKLSGDGSLFDEAVDQYRIYRKALRDPKTGLWSQGRGWEPTHSKRSKGAWCRGEGWIIRGMVESLDCIPSQHKAHNQFLKYLREFAAALKKFQDRRGMWHQVVDHPESYQETSGTGMIVHYIARAVRAGYLPARPWRGVVEKGYAGLHGFVTRDGTVLNCCIGCGTQETLGQYIHRPCPPDEQHGPGPMISGCVGRVLLDHAG